MDEGLLRQFIQATLGELRVDPKMMKLLKGSDLQHSHEPGAESAREVADRWLEELGGRVSERDRAIVTRFVARRLPGLVQRYRGNSLQAMQTMYNILDARFHDLRVY